MNSIAGRDRSMVSSFCVRMLNTGAVTGTDPRS
jgi:hypothetical protein